MRKLVLLILFSTTIICNSSDLQKEKFPDKYSALVSDFISSDWTLVSAAKDSLSNFGEEVIPIFLRLMDYPKEYKKLRNTMDLMYVGAENFYGHGRMIGYDIDWIAQRAAWALEDLTSLNFDFKSILLTDYKDLAAPYKNGIRRKIKEGELSRDFQKTKFLDLEMAISKVTNWWTLNHEIWNPLIGLKEAIFSNDIERQSNAIQKMRYPRFKIKGYSKEWFNRELRVRVNELNKSGDVLLKVQTGYLLRDTKI